MARVGDLGQIKSKHKALLTLLPYLVLRERVGDHRMTDALLGVVRVPNVRKFMVQPIATLLGEAGPDFPNRVMTLMSPHADCGGGSPTQAQSPVGLRQPGQSRIRRKLARALLTHCCKSRPTTPYNRTFLSQFGRG